ncbi:hypothetical protein MBLNU457_7771t1 [Dothideomycetes sp. NU457]
METAIIISSSPPAVAAATRNARTFSSSPFGDLPSPSTLSRKQNTVLKSGSNMMQPPEGAPMGFASARNLFHQQVELERETSPLPQKKASGRRRTSAPKDPTNTKTASTRKPRSKKPPKSARIVVSDDEETALDNTVLIMATLPINNSEVVEERRGSVSSVHEGKTTGKRKRAVKTPKEGEEKPKPKPRKKVASSEKVAGATSKRGASASKTKATVKAKAREGAEVETTDGVGISPAVASILAEQKSHHFGGSRAADAGSNARGHVIDEDRTLHSEPEPEPEVAHNTVAAPTRRRSWTPINHDLPTSFQEERASNEEDDGSGNAAKAFSHLVGAFALPLADPVVTSEPKAQTAKKTPTRKKRVEGAEGVPKARAKAAKPKVDKPKKEKAKKVTVPKEPKQQRLKNVTAYALAAYQQTGKVPDNQATELLTQYLETQPKSTNADGDIVEDLPDSAVARQKLGRIKFDFPMPDKACQKLKNQDFVFGTSSQLARDESPTFLRQTQQAIQESEEAAWLSQAASQEQSPSTSRLRVAQAPHGTSLSIAQSAGRLWGVATRDGDQKTFAGDERPQRNLTDDIDEFHDVDDMDDRRSHQLDAEPTPEIDERQDSGFVDISNAAAAARISSQLKQAEETVAASDHVLQRQENVVEESIPGPRQVLQEIDANASLHKSNVDSAQLPEAAGLRKARAQGDNQQLDVATKQMDKPSRARLKKSAVETDSKPVKPRGRPPGSKNLPKPAVRSSTPRKARKLPSSPFKDIDDVDEISDSEAGFATPSPPRKLASSPPVSPIPLQLSPKAVDTAITSQITQPPSEDKTPDCAAVFAEISRVIKAQPLTRDLARPTWYEKMLLYDPIVLEDLTAWLNEQGLRMQVEKTKTAGKSKGKSKAKSKGPELDLVDSQGQKVLVDERTTEMVMEELKPAFVQRWCEMNSICCLWKEGLRGGVRQKY